MAARHDSEGGRGVRGGIVGREEIRFVAEAVELGVGDGLTLLQTQDPELLLAAQAVTQIAAQVRAEQHDDLAARIVKTLAQAMKSK